MKFIQPPPNRILLFFSGQDVNKKKRLDDKDPSLLVYTPHRVGEKLEHGTIPHDKQAIHGLTSTVSNHHNLCVRMPRPLVGEVVGRRKTPGFIRGI